MFSPQNFQENTFLKTKPNFFFTGKCFPLTNFLNGKQTQESLESDFPEITFRKTNTAKGKILFWKPSQIFLWLKLTEKCFPLTGKCFPLTNFSNDKQTQESLKNGFPKTTFQETNMVYFFFPYPFLLYLFIDKIQKLQFICFFVYNFFLIANYCYYYIYFIANFLFNFALYHLILFYFFNLIFIIFIAIFLLSFF